MNLEPQKELEGNQNWKNKTLDDSEDLARYPKN